MAIAALVTWLLTAAGGLYMLTVWLRRGGSRGRSRFPTWLPFVHFGLAVVGLLLWIWYVATDTSAVAWVAFVVLLPVAALGFAMVARWFAGRTSTVEAVTPGKPAEQHFPVVTVGFHGVLAVVTLVLVLLAAIGVGDS